MKPLYAFLLIIGTLLSARVVFAEEIVVRLVDVRNGAGEKNCSVALLSSTSSKPAQQRWLTKRVDTGADGRARFSITAPLPSFVLTDVNLHDCLQCGPLGVMPIGDILRTGMMSGMDGRNRRGERYCRPDLKKLEEITAKPGEIVIFVRRLSFWEKLALF